MPERDSVSALVEALSSLLPPDTDATALADALWLAAAPVAAGSGPERSPGARPPAAEPAGPPQDPAPKEGAGPPPAPAAAGTPEGGGGVPLFENLPLPTGPVPDSRPVEVAAGRSLPHALELGRALRPFKRRHPRGARRSLDLDATLREYANGGELVPVLGPTPEPWFEVVLLVDTHPTMEVWRETVAEFTALLTGLGAFRRIRPLRLTVGPEPRLTDPRGRPVAGGRITAPGGRRLVIVLSDCTAPGWRRPEPWQLLRRWGASTPVVLLNPLPARLWGTTALDQPAVRVRHRTPSAHNTELSFDVPLMVRGLFGGEQGWVALPTVSLTPHSLRRWAAGVMRGAPAGYDAVLVPESGVLSSPFAAHAAPPPDASQRTAAFLHTASPAAKRLAALGSPFSRLSLPLLQLIRQEAVPEATVSDLAEVMTSGLLNVRVTQDGPALLTYTGAARAALAPLLTRHDAWTVQDALTRYVATHRPRPGRALAAVAVEDTDDLPAELQPFALASQELLTVLDGGRRLRAAAAGRSGADGSAAVVPVGPELPDPHRSAALLIGVSRSPSRPVLPGARPAVEGMHYLLTSPAGWNLPADRCWTLLDPTRREVLDTLERVCVQADDTVLVYFAGHSQSDPLAEDVQLLLAESSSRSRSRHEEHVPLRRLARLFESAPAKQFVLLLEACSDASEAAAALRSRAPDANVHVLGALPDTHLAGRSLPLADSLNRLASTGVAGGPDLFDLDAVAGLLARPPFGTTIVHSRDSRRPAPVLMRNPLALKNRPPHVRAIYDEVCRWVDDCLNGPYPGVSDGELHVALLALISFADGYPAQRPGSSARQLKEKVGRDLTAFLAPTVALHTTPGTGPHDSAGDWYGHLSTAGHRVPIEVRTLTVQGRTWPEWSARPDFRDPLRITVVLDRSGRANPSLFNLHPNVGVTTAHGRDGRSCTVLLRVLVVEPEPEPEESLDSALRNAVAHACSRFSGESTAGGRTLDAVHEHVPLMSSVAYASLSEVRPTLGTVEWHPVETYEHGLSLGEVRVDAEAVLEGFMFKTEPRLTEQEVVVVDPDWDQQLAKVSVHVDVELVFQAQIDSPGHQVTLKFSDVDARG
ncbi:SAV_2336 N-terminal domain-related protein [Kitasatospora sp. NPDC058170]|uniref:SAV_2336 N-terminal domain-related protein n=1 Tax=Kitasatospora sp. NPDC058170 TaxID=3346364 RepID=UPI0036DD9CD0